MRVAAPIKPVVGLVMAAAGRTIVVAASIRLVSAVATATAGSTVVAAPGRRVGKRPRTALQSSGLGAGYGLTGANHDIRRAVDRVRRDFRRVLPVYLCDACEG